MEKLDNHMVLDGPDAPWNAKDDDGIRECISCGNRYKTPKLAELRECHEHFFGMDKELQEEELHVLVGERNTLREENRRLKKENKGCKTKYTMAAYEKGIKQMERGKIHAAQIDTSPRLQRVLEVLLDGTPHTTREIIRTADVCCVNTIISELRDNGLDIECVPVKGKRAVYQYTLREG